MTETCKTCRHADGTGHPGASCKIASLVANLPKRWQAGCNHWAAEEATAVRGGCAPVSKPDSGSTVRMGVVVVKSTRRTPNKTEAEYRRLYLDPLLEQGKLRAVFYEGLTFRLSAGFAYTPDWVGVHHSGRLMLVEVKGAYRFGSHNRAQVAFKAAAAEWPMFDWCWAVKTKKGWKVT